MKTGHLLILTCLMITLVVVAACSGSEQSAEESTPSTAKRAVDAAQAVTLANPEPNVDPVCHMKLGTDYKTAEYETKMYGFCSENCVKRFEADPGKYLAKTDDPAH